MRFLPESNDYLQRKVQAQQTTPFFEVLFAKERRMSTIQLWISFFCTLVVLYFLLNWLPLLMGAQGLSKLQANYVQMGYNVGGILGSVLMGVLLDKLRMSFVIKLIYLGILFSLCCLAISPTVALLALRQWVVAYSLWVAIGVVWFGCHVLSNRNAWNRSWRCGCNRAYWFVCWTFNGWFFTLAWAKLDHRNWFKYSSDLNCSDLCITSCQKT